MAEDIQPIPNCPNLPLGECPSWIESNESLIFVEINEGFIFRFFPRDNRLQKMKPVGAGQYVSHIVPVDGTSDEFIVGIDRTMAWVKWPETDPDYCEKKVVHIASIDHSLETRFNDGKVDPKGRLWSGTFGYDTAPGKIFPEVGSLYCLNSHFSLEKQKDKYTISNGLEWSRDKTEFYFIDSYDAVLYRYSYNDKTGHISDRKNVVDLSKIGMADVGPDGMTIDNNGNLWICCFNGAKIICINPNIGKLVRQLEMPCRRITSCCFGGSDYSTLYVTSATLAIEEGELDQYPDSGKTFAVNGLGVKGYSPYYYKTDRNKLEKLIKSSQ